MMIRCFVLTLLGVLDSTPSRIIHHIAICHDDLNRVARIKLREGSELLARNYG